MENIFNPYLIRRDAPEEPVLEINKNDGGSVVVNADEFRIRTRNICDEIDQLKQQVDDIKHTLADLQDTVNSIWYAPGGPGYEAAKDSFERSSVQQTQDI